MSPAPSSAPFYWLKVKGNPFHRGRQTFQTATYAPNWPVSGNELLNAFRSVRGRPGAGVIAVDSVALARMLEFTGPITVPGYPTLTPDNFVFETVGNYIAYPDSEVRKRLNRSLAPAFTDALLDPRDVVDKLKAVHELAQARHFAVYFREPEPQAAFADLGLAGDLSDTEHDYLAVFSQNTNISKADYWQRRTVKSEVDLRPDGSASVRMSITVHNDSPPGVVDPYNQRGNSYTTPGTACPWRRSSRWAPSSLDPPRRQGRAVHTPQYYGRPFVGGTITFPPQTTKTYELRYDVPAAATVDDDGTAHLPPRPDTPRDGHAAGRQRAREVPQGTRGERRAGGMGRAGRSRGDVREPRTGHPAELHRHRFSRDGRRALDSRPWNAFS